MIFALAATGPNLPPSAREGRDMAPAPAARVSRALSDAWNYNRLQRTVLETQRDRILAEITRLESERNEIAARLKSEFQVDALAGDTWDERTLDVRRRTP